MRYLSLGGGVQSTCLALMAHNGMIDIDFAIFADTGWETKATIDNVDRLQSLCKFPIYTVSNGNIRDAITNGYRYLPYFTARDGVKTQGKRQCTYDFKLQAIANKTRELLGVERGKRLPKDTKITCLIGFSYDELMRRGNGSRFWWIENEYPLIDMKWTREDCKKYLVECGYGVPQRSACVGCPYKKVSEYQDLTNTERTDAVEIDKLIRVGGNYTHRSMKPLEIAIGIKNDPDDLFANECDGVCGL